MKSNKLIYLILLITILGTTSIASAATEETWNGITFTVPDGYNTGTPGADKIAMVNGGDRILIETFDEDGLNELMEESELKGNDTFNMNNLEITQLQFKTETGTKLLFLFSKNDKDYQISYYVPDPADEEDEDEETETEDSSEDAANEENTDTEGNDTETEENSDEDQIDFDINDTENPVNILINSLKF